MKALGFTIRKEKAQEADPFFLAVKLPDGWYKERDVRHPGWWLLCDGHDRLRCLCMEGHPSFEGIVADWQRRYDYDLQWHDSQPHTQRWVILDGGDILFTSAWQSAACSSAMAALSRSHTRLAVAWLNKRFPQWRWLDAYW